jgi:VCBS repeat-containing protein
VTFTYHVENDNGTESIDATVTITVTGENDDAIIGGQISGDADETGTAGPGVPGVTGTVATGTLTATDVDNADDSFTTGSGDGDEGYGSWEIDADGTWTYTVDDADAAVQALNVDDELVDTFTVESEDGTTQEITVTIHGQNDAASISGDTDGTAVEEGASTSGSDASGTLLSSDVDNDDDAFTASSGTTAHGSWSIDEDGNWNFEVDNDDAAVQALDEDEFLTDTFTVASIDGTTQLITVTINGSNDAPTIEDGVGSVDENASDLTNGDGGPVIVAALDVDDTFNAMSFEISGVDADKFEVISDGLGGWNLVLKAGESIDLDDDSNALQGDEGVNNEIRELTITVTDDNEESASATYTITVNAIDGKLKNGTNGADAIVGTNGDDTINGASGDDDISSGADSDVLNGGSGKDYLSGGSQNDTLNGNTDADTLSGGDGSDQLRGGTGDDTFVFNFGEDGFDTIIDFNRGGVAGGDVIQLQGFSGLGGSLAANELVMGSAATEAHAQLLYNAASGALSYDADGTGTVAAAVQIATINNGGPGHPASLILSDFQLIVV